MNKGLQNSNGVAEVLAKHEAAVLDEWIKQMSGATRRSDLIKDVGSTVAVLAISQASAAGS